MAKILHVSSDMNFGGVGRYLSLIDQSLHNRKDQVLLIVPKGSVLTEKIQHMEVITCEGLENQSFSIQGVKALKRLIKEIKPDIIHSHGALSARVAGRLMGVKTVFTKHTLSPPSHGIKKLVKSTIHHLLKSYAIAVSKGAYDNLIMEGYSEKRLSLIYNGVISSSVEVIENKDLSILFVGRLEPIKGPHECLKIVAYLKSMMEKPFQVTIAGQGSLRRELEEVVKNEALPVEFLGHVDDIDALYEKASIVINTSSSEALGYTALEAMNHSKPVIAYDVPGINEVVVDRESGYLIQPFESKVFAEKCKVLLLQPDQAKKMGQKGKMILSEKFSIHQMMDQLWKVYEEIL